MSDSLLQDYVVPICSAEASDGKATLIRLLGTAFFIDGAGTFLTASHVLEKLPRASPSLRHGLVAKSADVRRSNVFAPLRNWESAPKPHDIAIGKIEFPSRSWFSIPRKSFQSPWKDVATIGYPEAALNTDADSFNIHYRTLKGYIQRFVEAGEIAPIRPHPDCYELSFQITAGMSGAPLFTSDNNAQQLIGVCVGSHDSEIATYRSTVVEEDGHTLEEKSVKVEQIGIAQSIIPLLGWRPRVLGGRTIGEVITPTESTVT